MNFILLLICLGSLGGITVIVYRKIPLLLNLPAEQTEEAKQSVVSLVTATAREKILKKTLAGARAFASKTEAQTGEWLEKLRKRSERRKEEFGESYWDQLRKKSKDKNNPPA